MSGLLLILLPDGAIAKAENSLEGAVRVSALLVGQVDLLEERILLHVPVLETIEKGLLDLGPHFADDHLHFDPLREVLLVEVEVVGQREARRIGRQHAPDRFDEV